MKKTDWIFSEANHNLHQEFSTQECCENPKDNQNPAELIIDFPTSFNVTKGHTGDDSFSQLSVDIPSEVMDKLAITWCKKRALYGVFGGPVGREFGSVDCEYDDQSSHCIEQEDAELVTIVKAREEQSEIQANLGFDNIFDVVADSQEEAKRLQEESDELIKKRDVKVQNELFQQLPSRRKRVAFGILSHIRANQNIDDESSLLSKIEEALLAEHIMCADEYFLESAWRFEDQLAAGAYALGVNEKGHWLLVGNNIRKELLVTPLAPPSVKIVERLMQQSKLTPEQSPQWITPQIKLTMYRWKN